MVQLLNVSDCWEVQHHSFDAFELLRRLILRLLLGTEISLFTVVHWPRKIITLKILLHILFFEIPYKIDHYRQ